VNRKAVLGRTLGELMCAHAHAGHCLRHCRAQARRFGKVQRRDLRRYSPFIPMPVHPAFPRRRRTVPHSFRTQLLLTFSASRLGSAPPAKILVTTLGIGICGALGMRRRSLCCSLLLAGVGMLGRESCSRREGKKKLDAPFSFMPPCPAWVRNQRLLDACVNVEGGM